MHTTVNVLALRMSRPSFRAKSNKTSAGFMFSKNDLVFELLEALRQQKRASNYWSTSSYSNALLLFEYTGDAFLYYGRQFTDDELMTLCSLEKASFYFTLTSQVQVFKGDSYPLFYIVSVLYLPIIINLLNCDWIPGLKRQIFAASFH